MVESLLDKAGDTGGIPSPGRLQFCGATRPVCYASRGCTLEPVSLSSRNPCALEPVFMTREATALRSPHTAIKEQPAGGNETQGSQTLKQKNKQKNSLISPTTHTHTNPKMIRPHWNLLEWLRFKQTGLPSFDEDSHCWKHKMAQPIWKTVLQFLK